MLLLLAAEKKFGGSVTRGMNGKQLYIIGVMVADVPSAQEKKENVTKHKMDTTPPNVNYIKEVFD